MATFRIWNTHPSSGLYRGDPLNQLTIIICLSQTLALFHCMTFSTFKIKICYVDIWLYLSFINCSCCCSVGKLCLTLCDPMDCSPPGSSVHGIFQARILEWVAISSSRGSSQPRDPTPSPALAGRFFTAEPPGKPYSLIHKINICLLFARYLARHWK